MTHRTIRIKKGLDLHLPGAPQGDYAPTAPMIMPKEVAVCPDDFHGVVPRLLKKEGETVKAGEPLLFDKNFPELMIAAPAAGKVERIERGARRKIERVVIECAPEQEAARLTVSSATADDIRAALLASGLWAFIRQRPYDVVASPAATPRDIFISTFDSAPLAPAHSLLMQEHAAEFAKGAEILEKLTSGHVYIGCRPDNVADVPGAITQIITGPHPAGNAGVQIADTAPVNKGETVWAIDPETVVRIGGLFTTGTVDFSCIVSVTGEYVKSPGYICTIAGAPLSQLLTDNLTAPDSACRIISGNVLTGIRESIDGFLHNPFRQITVIPENAHPAEFMGWASLSPKKFSVSRSFFSWLEGKNKKFSFDAKVNGGERAIIMAGEYDTVFPMDIYAEFLIKAIIARDIDKMEQLGIYEVAPEDFALCEFIDTSKLPLQQIVRDGLDFLRKEMN